MTTIIQAAPKPVEATRYFISKRGLWFRPGAQGYTNSLAEAGRFNEEEAAKYRGLHGHYVMTPEGAANRLKAELEQAEERVYALRRLVGEVLA